MLLLWVGIDDLKKENQAVYLGTTSAILQTLKAAPNYYMYAVCSLWVCQDFQVEGNIATQWLRERWGKGERGHAGRNS